MPSRRAIGIVLLCLALPYLVFCIVQQWHVLQQAVADLSPVAIARATAVLVLMLALKSAYHVVAIRRLGNDAAPPASRIVSAYASSQVIRYLPGKVLGVVYEVAKLGGQVPAYRVVAANIVQGINTSLLTLGVLAAAAAWLYSGDSSTGLGAVLALFVLLWATHRLHVTERGIAWAARRIPRLRHLPEVPLTTDRGALTASLILFAEWIPYFAFWALLLPVGDASLRDAILLGTCYAGASLVANFAVVMPSGLIVREALFLWVGTQLAIDAADLILLGLVARVLFTLADACFVPLAWSYDRLRSWGSR